MNDKIKTYLWGSVSIAVLVVAFSSWSYVSSYAKSIQPSSFRSFSVSGEGKAVAIPDVAQFTFTVLTQGGKNIGALQKDNTDKMNEAVSFVKESGVEAKDIKTQQYSLEPRYQYYNCTKDGTVCPPSDIVGYTITQSVTVKVRDFAKAGDILGGVVEKGANSVSGLQFIVDDPTEVQNKAREEAVAKAKAKAEAMADAGGFSIGRLLNIYESGAMPQPYYYDNRMKTLGMGGIEAAAPSLEPGSQDTMVTVTLQYEIR